jgi:CO/xanthine dehydrogenase Mo-binding subunit
MVWPRYSQVLVPPSSSPSDSATRIQVHLGFSYDIGWQCHQGAQTALEKWRAEDRPAVAEYKYLAPPTTHMDKGSYSMPNFSYAYSAQVVDVEVDAETGRMRVSRVVSADDVGKAINPIW